ncbi:MAG: class I SAM-dependent methyltransferase [Acidobacteria bacterium]|nr:class I SAM-dependent methyltransferase [Acidobacteriota bacterium]MYI73928.1 class I SAM-dependent methyltransferase [Acidobacteriota bacterium]
MKISGGRTEDGVVFGNTCDKYGSANPVVQRIMRGFTDRLEGYVDRAAPASIHEVGCGEGYWTLRWARRGVPCRGTDFAATVIDYARANAREAGLDPGMFAVRSVYDLSEREDRADLVVCCEVLEHLPDPHAALARLAAVAGRHLILSVPREPLWRVLNVLRGAYLRELGNTPGHVQHWSRQGFVRFVASGLPGFDVVDQCAPLPWTMLLCRRRTAAA